MLLAIRGLPIEEEPKISVLAERLAIKHHSAVELIDRLQARGLVRRNHSPEDRRNVLVSLLPRGQKLLENVVRQRIGELRASGAALVDALTALIEYKSARPHRSAKYENANSKRNVTGRVQRRTAHGRK
jgi:DNA-binding MarR family transcriptional regulator